MNRKPTFFTSDWHIDHAKSIQFDKRPFKDLDDMHRKLIRRYNSAVTENGVCYFLGDMGNRTEALRNIIPKLNGTKVLVLGNHDHGINTMYNCGFDVVVFGATLQIMKQTVTMTHCPLLSTLREDTSEMKGSNGIEPWHGHSRPKHRVCSTENFGQFHLHGHIHSRKDKPQSQKILGRQFDVGVTANNYSPVSISVIESWIAKTLKEEKEMDEWVKEQLNG